MNFKFYFSFYTYNYTENSVIKTKKLSRRFSELALRSTFRLSDSNIFDLARVVNLLYKISKVKPYVFKKNKFSHVSLCLSDYFLYSLLSRLYKIRLGPKSNFITVFLNDSSFFVSIREPHLVFSVFSKYFDYHNSRYNFTLSHTSFKNFLFVNYLAWILDNHALLQIQALSVY